MALQQPEMQNFVVCSLPRSRSAWLSQFLTYGDHYCGHEQLRYMRSLDDVKAWLAQPNTGSCETAAASFWRLLGKYAPDVKIVTVRRPVSEVIESLRKTGLEIDEAVLRQEMIKLDRKLDQIESRMPNVLSMQFKDLENEGACKAVFEHCLPYTHDHQRWAEMSAKNIQINLPALARYVTANRLALGKIVEQARESMLVDFTIQPVDMTGVNIEEETIDDTLRDCQDLFRRHCVEVGEAPDNWLNKNIPMMRKLHELGMAQFMIGRSNGKAFGYLVSFLSPSLEAMDRMTAHHSLFYAAPECPGLGLKLQRTAIAALKVKGVKEVFMRAGIRGSGDRLGSIYKRIGAQNFGEMFRLELEA